jgi:phosphohistidine phosphatase
LDSEVLHQAEHLLGVLVNLLVIRHGPAEDADAWKTEGRDDRLRPLTPDGKKDMREAAFGMATLRPRVDLLATSPLVRAVQTGQILASEYTCKMITLDALVPDAEPARTLEWVAHQPVGSTVALVGHEPHLTKLVSYLLVGGSKVFLELKTGGACLLECVSPAAASFTLQWLLTRRELIRLGEK